MTAELWELLRLVVVGLLLAGAAIVVAKRVLVVTGESMAQRVNKLSNENTELRCEVARLQAAFDSVLEENRTLRGKVERLEHDLAGVTLLLRMNGVDIENLRTVIDSNAKHVGK